MTIVERNDVDISRLFSWSRECILTGLKGKDIKVYLRLLGDADMGRARVMALRKSAELRKSLRDLDSDDRLAFIPLKEEFGKEQLVDSILILTMRDSTKQAMKDVVLPRPKDPGSDASLERIEKFQAEVDEYPKKREEAIRKEITDLMEKQRKELMEQDENKLYTTYVNVLINDLCESELLSRFKESCIFFGAFSNKKLTEKFFSSFDEVDNLPTEIKEKLMDEYQLLEIESEELKK